MTDLYVIDGGLSEIKAVKHKAVPLSPDMLATEALRLVLLESIAHASANIPGVVTAGGEKSLHQLRVALRRLDTVLRVFGRVASIEVAHIRARLKNFLKATARARDLDVFIGMLPAVEVEARDPLQIELFRSHVDGVRRRAWRKAIKQVESLAFATLLDDVAMLVETAPRKPGKAAVKQMRRALERSWRHCRVHGRRFSSHNPRERHELRIRLKRLAYENEIFAALKPSGKAKRYRSHLSDLRDILGSQQDLAVARRSLDTLTDGDYAEAARSVLAYCRRHHGALEKKAKPLWKKFKKKKPYWL